jgi:phage gpG-like protein
MFALELDGLEEASARFDAYPAALVAALDAKASELSAALVDVVQNDKLSGGVLNARSGTLRDSIATGISSDQDGVSVSVGSVGDVKYAAIQEYGGKTSAHEILPVKAQALAFIAGGAERFVRRVEHPGSLIPERSYLRSLDDMRGKILGSLGRRCGRRMGARMTREATFSALFAVVSSAYPWGLASRRMKLWSEVPAALRPALFQLESGPETYQCASPATPKRTLEAKLFLYFNARDPTTQGATAINNALDAIDAALAPAGADLGLGRQTLGGAVDDCKIIGVPVRDTGDLDGDGLAVVSVRLVGP